MRVAPDASATLACVHPQHKDGDAPRGSGTRLSRGTEAGAWSVRREIQGFAMEARAGRASAARGVRAARRQLQGAGKRFMVAEAVGGRVEATVVLG